MSEQPTAPETSTRKSMDEIMALCKRRGFVYQASEIYGGINGFWDYGPLGAQLKKNLREAWWQDMIMQPCWGRKGPNDEPVRCVPVETRIVQHPKVWAASGHVAGFNDPMVDDKETKQRFRADQLYGVYTQPGMDEATSQTVRHFANLARPDINILPLATIIASTEGEAVEQLQSDKKLQKAIGIGAIFYLKLVEDGGGWYGELEFKGKPIRVTIRAVPMDQLKTNSMLVPSPFTGKKGFLIEPRQFNLMFKTYIGATATEDDVAYLRPETAQGIFVQFKNVVDTTRIRVPFGIGNTGTSFRNEVTPRNFTFRSREFDQAELEFFCHPTESADWYKFWRDFRMEWWQSLGLAGENLRLREHDKDELSHYSVGTSDVEYRFPFTAPDFGELEGIAHRGDYDLRQHQQHSGAKLEYFDTDRGETLPNGSKKGERYLPHCIEPAAGLDRGVLAILCEAYTKDASRPSPEIMKFHPRLAPIKAAVFPLVNKDGMPEVGEKLHAAIAARFGRTGFIEIDAKQSIGKRYARMDEAGCPFCFTVDGDTLKDQTVTVRDRDTGAQSRIAIDKVNDYLTERLG
ncbi:MAG: glycine--tRNA ligase [Phycisphaeraceae bacterium]|nr:glycine--tRNA ligase [Phycisphaeraceae bacterium]